MRIAKEYPIFSAIVGIFILLFIGGVVFASLSFQHAQSAEKNYKKAERRLTHLLTASPAPTQENVLRAQQNVVKLQIQVDKRMDATRGKMPDFARDSAIPRNPSEMFFQLQAYRNQFNADATELAEEHVEAELAAGRDEKDILPILKVPPDFAFGFSRYMTQPPAEKDIPKVYRQKEILAYILQQLYASKPHSIQAVMRESIVQQPRINLRQTRTQTFQDEFVMDAHLSSAREGAVDTFAFKIAFTGYTQSLRSFLTQLETFELPLVVRSVEVKPQQEPARVQATPPPSNDFAAFFGNTDTMGAAAVSETKRDPVVSNNVSEYSVMIEYIQVKSPNFEVADKAAGEDGTDS